MAGYAVRDRARFKVIIQQPALGDFQADRAARNCSGTSELATRLDLDATMTNPFRWMSLVAWDAKAGSDFRRDALARAQ
jgi:hypothetical protein